MAAAFAREHAGGWPVLADSARTAFGAAGLRRGFGSLLRGRLLANWWRASRRGFRQGRVQGDAWQLGGVVVLDRAGRVLHRQVDGTAGDELDVDAVLAACAGARTSR